MARRPPTTRPIWPNEGIMMQQRRRLNALIGRMVGDVIRAADHPPMAQDSLSDVLRALGGLLERWRGIWSEEARPLAKQAIWQAYRTSDDAFRRALRDHGFSVKFEMTPSMRAAMEQQLESNARMITGIPDWFFGKLETKIEESIEAGRDLGSLSAFLQESDLPNMTKRRAKTISLHQNNQATAAFNATRASELGLQQMWLHSSAGKTFRPTHVRASGTVYQPDVGWYDPDPRVSRFIWPGSLVNCRCSAKSVLPTGLV